MMARIDGDFKNKALWAKKSILAATGMSKFSSDRSIKEYADKIWSIKPLPVP
jgi:glycogen phosphorylase